MCVYACVRTCVDLCLRVCLYVCMRMHVRACVSVCVWKDREAFPLAYTAKRASTKTKGIMVFQGCCVCCVYSHSSWGCAGPAMNVNVRERHAATQDKYDEQ